VPSWPDVKHIDQYKKMPQSCELELAAVTVRVLPEMLHAAAMAFADPVPCTCALHACHLEDVSVAVQVVPAAIVQPVQLPPRCWPCVQSASTSSARAGAGCRRSNF